MLWQFRHTRRSGQTGTKKSEFKRKGQHQHMYSKKFNASLTFFRGTQDYSFTVYSGETQLCTKVPVCPEGVKKY